MNTIPITDPRRAAEQATRLVPAANNDMRALQEVVRELCLNALQWSESEHGSANVFVEDTDQAVIITVYDSGIGIAACMRRTYPKLAESEAVYRALERGTTSSREQWRGYGLASFVDLTTRLGFTGYLETYGVSLWIANGALEEAAGKSGGATKGTLASITYSRMS